MTSQIPDPNVDPQGDTPITPDTGIPGSSAPENPLAPQPHPTDAPASAPEPSAAPQAPQPEAPQAAPQAAPQYEAPQYEAPQYGTTQPGQEPPAGAPPHQGAYVPPQGSGDNNVQLNYWLSVFFAWIPALIFYLVDKDKGERVMKFHRDNLNFSLLRTALGLVGTIFGGIPVLGILITIVVFLGSIVLFVFHIMAAAKAKTNFEQGKDPEFIFNLPIIK